MLNMTEHQFRLAPMSPVIRWLTVVMLALPAVLFVNAVLVQHRLAGPAVLVTVIYAWIWLRYRPTQFIIHPDVLEIVWPLKRRRLARREIAAIRIMNREELRQKIGWGLRVGAGGLWGGFGWLWTRRRGIVQMYISRMDRFVWIELQSGRPWLITPEDPELFVQALSR
jgi:hypothetical protein